MADTSLSSSVSDGELVREAAAGGQRAWERLVQRYQKLVRSVAQAHRLSDADVADVTQTTWLRAVEHFPRLEDPQRVGAWLATVARNESLRVLRANARQLPTDEELLENSPDESAGPAASLLRAEREEALRAAFSHLPPRDRALLGMLAREPAPSYEHISAELEMPVGSIGPTRGRALRRLRCARPLVALAEAA